MPLQSAGYVTLAAFTKWMLTHPLGSLSAGIKGGVKVTRYARQLLDLINQSQEHMTAEQLYLELKKLEPKVVQATVYNNLNALYQEGLVRKLSVEGSPDRYDKVQRHDHLVCKICGALSDICFDEMTRDLERQLGESILSYDLKVFYLCPKCRGKNNRREDI